MSELNILSIATKIAAPLCIASLALLILFLLCRGILRLKIFPKLSSAKGFNIINNIINRIFILALVCLVLGIAAFCFVELLRDKSKNNPEKPIAFVTENKKDVTLKTDNVGFAFNFTLVNRHHTSITIYSMKIDLLSYEDNTTLKFKRYLKNAPPYESSMSAPIYVHGIRVTLYPLNKKSDVLWGRWEDSSGCRAALIGSLPKGAYKKMLELLGILFPNEIQLKISELGFLSKNIKLEKSDFELLPDSLRFSLAAGECESFYCQVYGHEEGIYKIRVIISYHCNGIKYSVASDQVYEFGTIDKFERALSH